MYSVRVAKAADAKKIARVQVPRWQITYRPQIRGTLPNARSVKGREAFWHQRLEQGMGSVFVIERDEVVGFCDLVPSRDRDAAVKTVGEIAALYVVSDHWRSGAGKTLLYAVLAEARKRGYKAIALWALASNSNAMRFYESLGFGRDGAVKVTAASDGSNLHEFRYRINFAGPPPAG